MSHWLPLAIETGVALVWLTRLSQKGSKLWVMYLGDINFPLVIISEKCIIINYINSQTTI